MVKKRKQTPHMRRTDCRQAYNKMPELICEKLPESIYLTYIPY